MPAAVRFGDSCTGHGAFPARNNDSASSNVFINGLGAHRVGDHWVTHCDPLTCHDGSAASGSSFVFVNGLPLCRVGDAVSCGSTMASGSPNVFVNG
jgi:uncharacterized Zn-binding protein involved in type VI secretion